MSQVVNRRQPREPLPYLIWRANLEQPAGSQSAICVDVSTGGVGLHVARPPEIGADVRLTVHLPDGSQCHGEGTVAHVSGTKPKVGVALHRMDDSMRRAIESAVLN